MQIIPDPLVVAIQLVPFLVTLVALHFIIFKPMIEYLDDRDKAQSGGKDEADGLRARIDEKSSDYEARLARARGEVVDLRAERRTAAMAEAEQKLEAARAAAEARVGTAVGEIEAERRAGTAAIQAASGDLADDIAGRVLGRNLQAG